MEHLVGRPFNDAGSRIVILVDAMAEAHQFELAGLDLLDIGGDVVLRADHIEHLQNFLVRPAMQRAGKRGCGGRRGEERVGLRTGYGAHSVGAAVLLVIGVEDEEDVQSARDYRVGLVLGLHHLPQHVHEVLGVAQVVVGIHVRESQAVPVSIGGDGGHLSDEAQNLKPAHLRIENVFSFRIHRGKRRHRADQHAHGVRVVAETFQKLLGGFVKHGVVGDIVHPVFQFRCGWKLAVEKQVSHFEKCALFRELLNGIAAVSQDASIAVDVGNGAAARGRIHESRVVGHEPEIFGPGLDLAQIHGPYGSILDGNLVRSLVSLVDDAQRVFCHILLRVSGPAGPLTPTRPQCAAVPAAALPSRLLAMARFPSQAASEANYKSLFCGVDRPVSGEIGFPGRPQTAVIKTTAPRRHGRAAQGHDNSNTGGC